MGMRRVAGPAWLGSLCLSALFALSGCASVEGTSRLQGIKTVGIISAIGDKFSFTPSGLTSINNAPRSFSIEPWGIDDQIVARATSVLGQRFQVQAVTYHRELFAEPEHDSSIPGADLVRDDPFKELVRSHVQPQGLDAYVAITKATPKYGTRGAPVSGIGLIKHSALLDSSAVVHALYVVRVVDGHSFRTVDKKSAPPMANSGVIRLAGPSREFDPGDQQVFYPLQNEPLRAAVIELINQSLDQTLRDLRLTAP
jgi:hypothetical protein